jgi:hypothetical protein
VLSIRTFVLVTGPKVDLWLVKTVGAVLAVIGATLALAGRRRRVTPEVALLGAGSAATLAAVDVVYAGRGRISRIYLLDALAQVIVIVGWALARRPR